MEPVDKLAKALVGFQADMENVTKDATNPFFKSKYATLEAIITAAKPHLKKHGLAVVQLPENDGLTTCIMHESGQNIRAFASLHFKENTPQAQGSAITYMRRYALSAALGIATEDDDDGNEASKPAPKPAAKVPKSPVKEDPRTSQIKEQLAILEVPCGTIGEAKASVKKLTGMDLVTSNFDAIISKLREEVEKTDPFKGVLDQNK